jgi:hypothetical protein
LSRSKRKLTDEQVKWAREKWATGQHTVPEFAAHFGCSYYTIRSALMGQLYKTAGGPCADTTMAFNDKSRRHLDPKLTPAMLEFAKRFTVHDSRHRKPIAANKVARAYGISCPALSTRKRGKPYFNAQPEPDWDEFKQRFSFLYAIKLAWEQQWAYEAEKNPQTARSRGEGNREETAKPGG